MIEACFCPMHHVSPDSSVQDTWGGGRGGQFLQAPLSLPRMSHCKPNGSRSQTFKECLYFFSPEFARLSNLFLVGIQVLLFYGYLKGVLSQFMSTQWFLE